MVNCIKCCLHKSMRIVNLVVNLFAVGLIIYSLWLLKRWKDGIAELGPASALLKPWFIYTSLGMGIVVCLSMLSGHMVANCISILTLSVYIVFVCSILFLQIMAIVATFFKMDWEAEFSKYIDTKHENFKKFLIFHVTVCSTIAVAILVAQVNSVILAIVLWTMGPEPWSHCHNLDLPELRQSFLVRPDSPVISYGPEPIEGKIDVFKLDGT